MMRRDIGKLFVFEGPDGCGKTTLSRAFATYLESRGLVCDWFSFPGTDPGTLGKHVYGIHHNSRSLGLNTINPTSIQLLHIAAHVDSIEGRILPALKQGRHVILDRFWWSTLVYGTVAGASPSSLEAMVAVELLHWGSVIPSHVFLLRRETPHGENLTLDKMALEKEYAKLAIREAPKYPVTTIANDASTSDALESILSSADIGKQGAAAPEQRIAFCANDDSRARNYQALSKPPTVFSKLAPAKPTVVYDTYWRFAAERQAIFFRKLAGAVPPWTADPILREYKFTNAYRASDRTSQYLISQVIYAGDQAADEMFFRTVLFKMFNRIATWELLLRTFGHITYRDYSFARYDATLSAALEKGQAVYSAAYIMPSGTSSCGSRRKHRMHLRLIEQMLKDELFARLAEAPSMGKAFELLKAYPTIGDFLAYQYVTDLNYSTLLNFSEMEFVVPGPGARDGIRKCFSDLGGLNECDIIKLITDRQQIEFEKRGEHFKSLWGRPLQLIDCQNLFCEVDKYSRVKHPECAGRTGRLKIKQKYRVTPEAISFWYPPKWGLNENIEKGGLLV
jgi:thymidylate kinase